MPALALELLPPVARPVVRAGAVKVIEVRRKKAKKAKGAAAAAMPKGRDAVQALLQVADVGVGGGASAWD